MLLAALLFLSSCDHKHSTDGLPPGGIKFLEGVDVYNDKYLLVTAWVQDEYKIVNFEPSLLKDKIKVTMKPEDNSPELYKYETIELDGISIKVYKRTLRIKDQKYYEVIDSKRQKIIEAIVEHDYVHTDDFGHDGSLIHFNVQDENLDDAMIQHHVSHKVVDPRGN